MTRKFVYGFDTGSLSAEPTPETASPSNPISAATSTGSVSLNTNASFLRTGAGSLKLTPASGAAGYYDISNGLSIGRPFYYRFYALPSSLPASQRLLAGSTEASALGLRINSDGSLQMYNNTTSLFTSSTKLTDTSKWYRIEIKSVSSPSALVELLIDGVSQGTSASSAAMRYYLGANDTVAATYTIYIDDIVIDDSSYPGDGKVLLLVPISDNARATLWTAGAGGTSNLFAAVDNTPPTGTASETDSTQIEHAGGAAGTTDAYDANMTAYSTAGIASGDTINSVMPFVWCGEDSATGDKLLSFNIKSNPATTNSGSFNVADSSSGALGTWPTGWWRATAALGGAPSDLTSPVMTVIRPETASRVASVCFMGIYVDYTPAAGPVIPVFMHQYRRRWA